MTAKILPFANMQQLDPALLQEMLKEMAMLQAKQRRQQQAQQQNNWRNLTKRNQDDQNPLMGLLLGTLLFSGLFDSPLFQNFGALSQNLDDLSEFGLMNIAEDGNQPHGVERLAQRTATAQLTPSKPFSMTDFILLALLIKLMSSNKDESGETDRSGGGMLVPDVLRHPTMAQFKQNRKTIACTRTLFLRQANDVVSPRAKKALRFAM